MWRTRQVEVVRTPSPDIVQPALHLASRRRLHSRLVLSALVKRVEALLALMMSEGNSSRGGLTA